MNVNSVKDRLKNLAKETGKTMQEMLVLYGLERTIYRISISEYAERFTLKGGIFLYALFDGDYARATTDIDLLAQYIPNDTDRIKEVFTEIFTMKCDDGIRYDLETLQVINITEFKEYHGVKVTVMGYLDKTRLPVAIDIGFGDVIYPKRMQMEFPVLLKMEPPQIFTYSVVSAIAEKFEAFVELGLANSRYKDFYDIYVLATEYDIDGNMLQCAVIETFKYRDTEFEDIVAFDTDFSLDKIRQKRWDSFIKKKKALLKIEFKEALDIVGRLLLPIVEAIQKQAEFNEIWIAEELRWEKKA